METLADILVRNAIEATVLALVLALSLRALRLSAPVRHTLCLLVLVKLLAPPLAIQRFGLSAACDWLHASAEQPSPPVGDQDPPESRHESRSPARPDRPRAACALVESYEVFADPESPSVPRSGLEAGGVEPAPDPSRVSTREAFPDPDSEDPRAPAAVFPPEASLHDRGGDGPSPAITSVPWRFPWILGSAIYLGACVLSAGLFAWRTRHARAVPSSVNAIAVEVARSLGLRRAPRVACLRGSFSPLVRTLGRPLVLLPEALCENDRALRGVLAHEFAHVRRKDHWLCWLELSVTGVFWWLPTVWWARVQLRQAGDEIADAEAVGVLGSRRSYARALLEIVERLNRRISPLPAPARGLNERESLSRRLTMVMRDPLSKALSWRARLVLAAVALLVLPVAPAGLDAGNEDSDPVRSAPRVLGDLVASSPEPAQEAPGVEATEPAVPSAQVNPDAAGAPTLAGGGVDSSRVRRLEQQMGIVLEELRSIRAMLASREPAEPRSTRRAPTRRSSGEEEMNARLSFKAMTGREVRTGGRTPRLHHSDTTLRMEGLESSHEWKLERSLSQAERTRVDALFGRFRDELGVLQDEHGRRTKRLEEQYRDRITDVLNHGTGHPDFGAAAAAAATDRIEIETTEIGARVEAIDEERAVVVLSVGSKQGVERGDQFVIEREGELIGKLEATTVHQDFVGARVISLEGGARIRRGDRALTSKTRYKVDGEYLERRSENARNGRPKK